MVYEKSQFKPRYMIIIGGFYMGQGYSLGSLVLLLPIYINEVMGTNLPKAVALSALIVFPWYLKFLFGILSDNYPIMKYGRRKPYLVIATIFSILGWINIGSFQSPNFNFIISGISLAIGSALADAVIDGQVTEITPDEFIGRIQGFAWGGRGFGMGMAASLSPFLVGNISWNAMFIMASIFGIGISILALTLPQIQYKQIEVIGSKTKHILKELNTILIQDKSYKFSQRLIFIFATGAAISIVPILPIIMREEFGYSFNQIGFGSLMFALGSLVGSLIVGIILDKYESKRSFRILSVIYGSVFVLGLIFQITDKMSIQSIYLFLVGVLSGAYESHQLKVIQESSTLNHEGTIFAIFTSISNVGQFVIGGWLLVFISEFFSISLFTCLLLVLIPLFIAPIPLEKFKYY